MKREERKEAQRELLQGFVFIWIAFAAYYLTLNFIL
tara:strand:+ start:589 stop:696 length:108 start_codon:yes stop_codon:yes gene_type:complete